MAAPGERAVPGTLPTGFSEEDGVDDVRVTRYLERIGADRPARPDAAALADLQLRHLRAVPFENLSIHLGEPIVLEEDALFAKIVEGGRGGFCYELNGLFALLLGALGYDVTLLAARVFGANGIGPPFDHLTLRVDCPDPWLVDVGFGRNSRYPLRFEERSEQPDPDGTFRLVDTDEGDVDLLRDGRPQFRIERRPRALADCEATCWYQQTSPRSAFVQSPVCSLLTESGRTTLSGDLLIRTEGAERHEETLIGDDAVLAAYRDLFGVRLDRVPATGPRQPAR
jgi:N-hydroxyarylamine O-acetyltransferase